MANDLINPFRSRLPAEAGPKLWAEIDATLTARRVVKGGHTDWGLFCEEAGLLNLAFREFQLALRDDPGDAQAAFHLAQHYREHGDTRRAADLLERLLAQEPAREEWLALYVGVLRDDGALPRIRQALERAVAQGLPADRARALAPEEAGQEEAEPEVDLQPTDADCVRFQSLFAGREDVHARQWARGGSGETGYSPVHEPLTPAVVRNHLLGTYTVGVYPIRLDGTCTFFAVDLDVDKGAIEQARGRPEEARRLRDALRQEAARLIAAFTDLGLAPLFEDSGYKGRHFWVFLEQPEPAEVLHQLGRLFLAWQTPQLPRGLHLEFFPKQGGVKVKGLGNLIKLPLGIHRRTGRRAVLLDEIGRPLPAPLAALRGVQRLPQVRLHALVERLKGQAAPAIARAEAASAAEEPNAPRVAPGPPPPPTAPVWTDADFQDDQRFRHLLARCPVLTELKHQVEQHRRLSHEEQLVLIHTLGHLEGGPQAVNYLFDRCVDVGPEKRLKDRLKGNPVSCPSIRKKIGHVTRRVACNCSFDWAPDRYPTPTLHLLTLPAAASQPAPTTTPDAEALARRYAAAAVHLQEVQREYDELRRSLLSALRAMPDRVISCPGGRYRLLEESGVEELRWEPDAPAGA
jgi:hypothetical protein